MSRRAWMLFSVVSIVWGLPYLFIKIAVAEFSPLAVVWLRCLLAAIVLLPLAIRRGALAELRGRWRPLVVIAAVEVTVPFSLISAGEQHISSSLTGLLIAAVPLVVALLAIWIDPSERVVGWRLVGLFVGFGGVAALLGLDVGGDANALLGAAMVLAATVFYSVGPLVLKRSFSDTSAVGPLAVAVTLNAIVLAPFGFAGLPDKAPSAAAVSSIVILGLVCTAGAMVAFFRLIQEAGPSRASVITYVNPAVAVTLGFVVLGEPVTTATVVGFLLIIAGSWLSTGGRVPRGLAAPITRVLRPDNVE